LLTVRDVAFQLLSKGKNMDPNTLSRHEHLLSVPPGSSENVYWAAAGRFTNACCWDERNEYRMIRKTGGRRCINPQVDVDCDKVVEIISGKYYDVVVGGGQSGQHAGWSEQSGLVDEENYVMPYDPGIVPEPPKPPTDTIPWQPYWGDEATKELEDVLAFDYARRPQGADFGVAKWASRTVHSAYMGPEGKPLGFKAATDRHRPEWCEALKVPVVPYPPVE
jgi:hypothetical protein